MLLLGICLVAVACGATDGQNVNRDVTDLTAAGLPTTPNIPPETPSFSPTKLSTPTSSGSGLSGKAFLSDDFTSYHSTADLTANISTIAGGPGDYHTVLYTDGHDANLVELDQSSSNQYNGHASMRYDQFGGTAATPALWPTFPNGKTLGTMWLRAKIKMSSNFTTTGTLTNSANAYKLLGWAWADGLNGRGGVAVTNTTQYQLYWQANTSAGVPTTGMDFAVSGNVASEWRDGQWYDYILEYHITSPTTGVARFWMAKDGQIPVLRGTSVTSAVSGYNVPRVGSVQLGLNFNQVRATNQTQYVWYGQWEVVDGDQYPDPFNVAGGSN